MYPKTHIMLGVIFIVILYFLFPKIGIPGLFIIFLSSILIDVDHYLAFVIREKNLSLIKAYNWTIEKMNRKEYLGFHFLHTIEVHILVVILTFFWHIFFFVFIGFLFHSITDFIKIRPERREYFLTRWMIKKYF